MLGRRIAGLSLALAAVFLAVAVTRDQDPPPPLSDPEVSALIAGHLEDAPRDDGYRIPTARESGVALRAFAAAASGEAELARELAGRFGYEVLHLDGAGEPLLALHERPGGVRGWGLYLFAPARASGPVVEVPHPLTDLYTADLGVDLFLTGRGGALLVAGAHRDAAPSGQADVAHRADSIFESAHRAVLADDRVMVQLHGFHASDQRPFDAVVSPGRSEPDDRSEAVSDELARAGVRVCRFEGRGCDSLGGTTNVQADSAARAGAEFVHLELALPLRARPAGRRLVVRAVLAAVESRRFPPSARARSPVMKRTRHSSPKCLKATEAVRAELAACGRASRARPVIPLTTMSSIITSTAPLSGSRVCW